MDTDKDIFSLDSDDLFADNAVGWVVITSHAQHFIGCLSDHSTVWGDDSYSDDLHAIEHFKPVTLYPAFEFAPMMVPVPRRGPDGQPVQGFARQPFISTPHFTTEPLTVRVKPTSYYLFSDMKETDRTLYKELVKSAIAQAKQERLARSNIVTPSGEALKKVIRGLGGA